MITQHNVKQGEKDNNYATDEMRFKYLHWMHNQKG